MSSSSSMPTAWRDQIGPFELPAHPLPQSLSDINSELSSAPTDSELWFLSKEKAEQALFLYTPVNDRDDTAKILAVFLKHLPKSGQLPLMGEILHLWETDRTKLLQLRNFLVDAILKPIGGASATPLTRSTHQDAEDDILGDMAMIEGSSRNDQSRLKQQCRLRDGRRCVLTGAWDRNYIKKKPRPADVPKDAVDTFLECAHIIPFSLRKMDENKALEVRNKTTIWWALHRYFPSLRGKIDASTINKPSNAMSMCQLLHTEFDSGDLFLSPIHGKPDTYNVHRKGRSLIPTPNVVTFTSHDPNNGIPLPDPDFLDTHCRLGKILEVSGIGYIINHISYQAALDPYEIAPDGSTDLGAIIARKLLILDFDFQDFGDQGLEVTVISASPPRKRRKDEEDNDLVGTGGAFA